MEEKSNQVPKLTKLCPLELDELLNRLGLEDLEFIRVDTKLHNGNLFVIIGLFLATIVINVVLHVLGKTRKQIDGVLDLVNLPFLAILIKGVFIIHFSDVAEDRVVCFLQPDIENRAVVGHGDLIFVEVGAGPLIEIESIVEHLRVKETHHVDALFKQENEVLVEQVRRVEVVLVISDVVDDQLGSA